MWIKLFFITNLCNVIHCAKLYNQNVDELKHFFPNNDEIAIDNLDGLNRVLVKRVIPHDYESNGVEYNKKLNYVYNPLVRFHVQKPVNDVPLASDDEVQNEKLFKEVPIKDLVYNLGQNSQRVDSGKNKRLISYKEHNLNRDEVTELLKLFGDENDKSDGKHDQRINSNNRKRKLQTVNIITKLLDEETDDRSQQRKARDLLDAIYGVKSNSKKEFRDKLGKSEKRVLDRNLMNQLTQVLRYGGDKPEPQLHQSIFAIKEEAAASMTEKPKMDLPFYPFWNWWTYKKTLYHDNCRNGWVRFHNMCYELPPH